jgi:hypothetical protein
MELSGWVEPANLTTIPSKTDRNLTGSYGRQSVCHFVVHPVGSHSHRNLEKVRRIRNELKRRGHNPLLFFLKCLEADDMEKG